MNIYKEIEQILELRNKIDDLIKDLEKNGLDTYGLDFAEAYFVKGCVEKNGHLYQDGRRLDNSGLVDNDYYCNQHTGYLEDDFFGTLFFATDKESVFIGVPFAM